MLDCSAHHSTGRGDATARGAERADGRGAAARRISGARLVEIPEAGHLPQVESFAKY
jgi:hypothetical protein